MAEFVPKSSLPIFSEKQIVTKEQLDKLKDVFRDAINNLDYRLTGSSLNYDQISGKINLIDEMNIALGVQQQAIEDANELIAGNLQSIADLQNDMATSFQFSSLETRMSGAELLLATLAQADHEHQEYDFKKTGWTRNPDATMGVMDITRTFYLDYNSDCEYFINGERTIKDAGTQDTIEFPDEEGIHFFMFDNTGLITSRNVWTFDATKVPVAVMYWDATNKKQILLGLEFHSWTMDDATHESDHHTDGTKYAYGFAVTQMSTTTVKVDPGVMYDEDIRLSVGENIGLTQTLNILEAPIYYRDDNVFRKIDASTDTAYLNGGQPKVNIKTTTWEWRDVPNNKFFVSWLFSTNDVDECIAWLPGQHEGDQLEDAKLLNNLIALNTEGLPFEEFVIIGRLIMKAGVGSYEIVEFEDYRIGRVASATVNLEYHIHDDRYYTEAETSQLILDAELRNKVYYQESDPNPTLDDGPVWIEKII